MERTEKENEIRAPVKQDRRSAIAEGTILREVLLLLVKVISVIAALALIFTLIFGIYRNRDVSMHPAVKDGDLVIYFRMDKAYVKDELAVVEYQGELQTRRVVAIAGDTVDIDTQDNCLVLNGSPQQEIDIRQSTIRYDTGVNFPLTVGDGQIFVLGDGRENSTDSRVYGCVDTKNTLGKVATVIRTRGF